MSLYPRRRHTHCLVEETNTSEVEPVFAIDHAATALLLKRAYPSLPMAPLLLSVQAMEFAWVGLNYLGIERVTTDAHVESVTNIHLSYMPYSHSVGTALAAAVIAWVVLEKGAGHAALGRAVGLGIASHLVLDLVTHDHDLVLWPGVALPRLGLGLYGHAPLAAFALAYGRSVGLLALIVLGNLANASFFSSAIPGPEELLADRPLLIVTAILIQIAVTLVLVHRLTRRDGIRAIKAYG